MRWITSLSPHIGPPSWLTVKNLPAMQEMLEFDSWFGKIPERRAQQPTPVFLPAESDGQRSLAMEPGLWLQSIGHKESDTTEATEHTHLTK